MPPSRAGPPPAVAPAYSGVWAATRLLRGRRRRRRCRWLRRLTPHPPLPRPGLTPGVRRANVRQAEREFPRRLRPVRRVLREAREHEALERRRDWLGGPGRRWDRR